MFPLLDFVMLLWFPTPASSNAAWHIEPHVLALIRGDAVSFLPSCSSLNCVVPSTCFPSCLSRQVNGSQPCVYMKANRRDIFSFFPRPHYHRQSLSGLWWGQAWVLFKIGWLPSRLLLHNGGEEDCVWETGDPVGRLSYHRALQLRLQHNTSGTTNGPGPSGVNVWLILQLENQDQWPCLLRAKGV